MLIMPRLPTQQPQQPAPQGIGMQPGDVTSVFPYENAVVTYEQQIQQQLKQQQHQQQLSSSSNINNSNISSSRMMMQQQQQHYGMLPLRPN